MERAVAVATSRNARERILMFDLGRSLLFLLFIEYETNQGINRICAESLALASVFIKARTNRSMG